MTIKTITHHPLFAPLTLAFVLRIIFMALSHHVYYPDEIYQSLEQAHRMVRGVGLIPWDITYGLRSFVFPLFLAIPLKLASLLGINAPEIYRWFPQLTLILLSLAIPAAGYVLTYHVTHKKDAAQFTALALASWYELIYIAGRALTESVSVMSFACSTLFLYQKKPNVFLTAVFLTLGLLLRPQFFPVALTIGYLLMQQKGFFRQTLIGASLTILLFGSVDLWFSGSFLSHLFLNLKLSFASGISVLFGTQPWYFYLATLTISSAGLWLSLFFVSRHQKATLLQITFVAILLIHSLISHKEYRFITILIPIWITLLSLFLEARFAHLKPKKRQIAWQYATILFCIISFLGIMHKLPMQMRVYGQSPIFTDPTFAIYDRLSTEPIRCGIFDTSRNWVYTPGYYGLNQAVALYSADYPPPSTSNADYVIIPRTNSIPSGFTKVFVTEPYKVYVRGQAVTLPGYSILKTKGECVKDSRYTANRSFPAIESVLQSIHATPVIR